MLTAAVKCHMTDEPDERPAGWGVCTVAGLSGEYPPTDCAAGKPIPALTHPKLNRGCSSFPYVLMTSAPAGFALGSQQTHEA